MPMPTPTTCRPLPGCVSDWAARSASAHIRDVRQAFRHTFNLEPEFCLDGSQFDYLFEADEAFRIGNLAGVAMHVPGHTPADIAYRVDDTCLFVGDTLFMPDVGTARCDFPGGSAAQLYRSTRRILALPDGTRLYLCHDYPPDSRQGLRPGQPRRAAI
jgi:glyoxylase-like metal-dependent hydrolase (beta-lactamase superfamily II)